MTVAHSWTHHKLDAERSNLQWLLLSLFAASLVAILFGANALDSAGARMQRDDDRSHSIVRDFTDVRSDVDALAIGLAALASHSTTVENTSRLHSAAVGAVESAAGELRGLNDPATDESLIELIAGLDHAEQLLTSSSGVDDPSEFVGAATTISAASHDLVDSARLAIEGGVFARHISPGLRLGVLLIPLLSLIALLAANFVMNRDVHRAFSRAKSKLRDEDLRRQHSQRIILSQAKAMEMIAAGATEGAIRAEISRTVRQETGNVWSTGPEGLTTTSEHAEPVPPELADSADRILKLTAKRDESTKELVYQANHDSLTGLYNRSAVIAHIDRALMQRLGGALLAVIYIDLGRFKRVNDTYGHATGDEVLREAANRVRFAARRGDLVGRIGGDEFIAVLYPVTLESAHQVARRIVESTEQPYKIHDIDVQIGVSVGISIADGAETDATRLMRDADHAMYRAKQTHESIVIADEELRQTDRHRSDTEKEISASLRDDGVVVLYQPIVDTTTCQLHGVEALVRLRSADRLLTPAEFIDIAEKTGQIVPIDHRVLEIASRQVADWNRRFNRGIELAVNMSAVHINRRQSLLPICGAVNDSGLASELLTIEINEAGCHEDCR